MSDYLPPTFSPRIRVAGTGGLVVEFGAQVDPWVNLLVVALDARLQKTSRAGVVETVPTYRSLLVLFDPLIIDRATLMAELRAMAADLLVLDERPTRCWHVPVAYGSIFEQDLRHVGAVHDLDPEDVAHEHASGEYRVYMIGFAPGFTYLGGLPRTLHTPRRLTPRQSIPAGCVTVGGMQAAITSIDAPSGWHVLGRTPLRIFDLRRPDPFLFRPGDHVRFLPITETEFSRLSVLSEGGAITAEVEEIA